MTVKWYSKEFITRIITRFIHNKAIVGAIRELIPIRSIKIATAVSVGERREGLRANTKNGCWGLTFYFSDL